MALEFNLWAGAQSAYSGAHAAYHRASNVVSGATFNRRAYNEALGYKFENEDVDCDVRSDSEEEWTDVKRKVRRWDQPDEPYLIKDGESEMRRLRVKISKEAIGKASKAAGVSADYVKWALKFAAVEAARDIGFLTNCKSATDAVKAIKARFPVIEDIQVAYHSGSLEGSAHRSTSQESFGPRQLTRLHRPQAGINHPRDIQGLSNLDDIAIIGDETIDAPIYHRETRAELELVLEPVYSLERRQSTPMRIKSNKQKFLATRAGELTHVEFDDVDLGNDETESMLGSMVLDDDRLTYSGPLIGGVDSEELKAREGVRAARKVEV